MNQGSAVFIIIIAAIGTVGWVLNSWIRAKHAANPQWDGATTLDGIGSVRQIELLSTENAGLKNQIGRLEERIATLERIAVDPAERIAREIESLRTPKN